jgi:hypothetical protein
MQQQTRDVGQTWQAIDSLKFDRIKAKLLHQQDGGWTAETVARAEQGYRQFLKLSAKYPDVAVVPNEEVDHFWHAHILDTQRYTSDCERLFGDLLHHDPYVGIDGAEDEAHLQELAAATAKLVAHEFGAASETDKPAYCAKATGAQAKPAYCARATNAQAKPAYCARATGAQAKPAYCARATGAQAKPAYCARATDAQAKPAYGPIMPTTETALTAAAPIMACDSYA